MACVRKRRGKHVVDWRDGTGRRRWKSFDRKRDADSHRDKVAQESRQRLTPAAPATSTMAEYAEYWQRLVSHIVKRRTLTRYIEILRLHILPRFGKVRVRDMDRGRIKLFLTDK